MDVYLRDFRMSLAKALADQKTSRLSTKHYTRIHNIYILYWIQLRIELSQR